MKLSDSLKISKQVLRHNSFREIYWEYCRRRDIRRNASAEFREYLNTEQRNFARYISSPTSAPNREHLEKAVKWVLKAQAGTPDAGVSLGYFPGDGETPWRPSYPETTGYLITSLIRYAERYADAPVRTAALAMARWEIDVQMNNGAVQGGPLVPADEQTAAAFNTGMVLDGWCTAYESTGHEVFLEAAIRAGKFLERDLGDDGFFRTNGKFVTDGKKTYTCLVCWSMYRLGEIIESDELRSAAIFAVENAVRQQNTVGWFDQNCLSNPVAPLTHTIGYALQGILEVGLLAGRSDLVDAAEKGIRGVFGTVRSNGWLSGRLSDEWSPGTRSVCLTGSCQLAAVGFRLAAEVGKADLVEPARRLLRFVKATQRLEGEEPGLVGGIAGSFPILGGYMTGGFPNWATKYFIDAMLMEDDRS